MPVRSKTSSASIAVSMVAKLPLPGACTSRGERVVAIVKAAAKKMIDELNAAGEFADPIVTTLEEMKKWYPAEDYHQEYFELNPSQPYCQRVVGPKVSKFQKRYQALLKKSAE